MGVVQYYLWIARIYLVINCCHLSSNKAGSSFTQNSSFNNFILKICTDPLMFSYRNVIESLAETEAFMT